MKLGKTLISILAGGLILFAGCKEYRTEYSAPKNEDAVVSEKYHRSAYITFMHVGKTMMPLSHPAVNRTTFDGIIDFTVSGREIYDRFNEQDKANVFYREVYRLTYDDLDKDGKKEFVNREFVDYEFLDAQPAMTELARGAN